MPDITHIPSRTPLRLAARWAATSSPEDRPGVIAEIRGYPAHVQPRLISLIDAELRLLRMPGSRASFENACLREFGHMVKSNPEPA